MHPTPAELVAEKSVERKPYLVALLPHKELTPEACGAVAIALEEAVEVIEKLGVRVGSLTRAHHALQQLRRVAREGSYGSSVTDLHKTARAIFLANDFYAISRVLPEAGDPVLLEELHQLMRGTLDESSTETRGYETQSQFWMGTLLAYSGLKPTIPRDEGSRPDFVVTIEHARLSVEVKRPRTSGSCLRSIAEADRQLRSFKLPGFIVIDASEALGTRQLTTLSVHPSSDDVARDKIRAPYHQLARTLQGHITRAQPSGHNRTVGLVVYARHCAWLSGKPNRLDLGFFLSATTFPKAAGGIAEHYAERFIDRLKPGIERMTNTKMIRG